MRYIRTNKEILYLVSEPIYADDGACEQDCYECITSKGKTRYIYENDIVKQADTIEELCDEFVCDHNNGTRVIQIKECKPQFPLCKDTIDYFKRNNQTFYGAIWTDKGLIYVAKMNDKGDLELL